MRPMLLTNSIRKEEFEWLKSTWKVNNRFLEETDRAERVMQKESLHKGEFKGKKVTQC